MFNIIDFATNYKADFIILKNDSYRIAEFERRKKINFSDIQISLVSPEDLIISKIIWIQQSESSLQKQDIQLLLQLKDIDLKYIKSWVNLLKLNTFNLI